MKHKGVTSEDIVFLIKYEGIPSGVLETLFCIALDAFTTSMGRISKGGIWEEEEFRGKTKGEASSVVK